MWQILIDVCNCLWSRKRNLQDEVFVWAGCVFHRRVFERDVNIEIINNNNNNNRGRESPPPPSFLSYLVHPSSVSTALLANQPCTSSSRWLLLMMNVFEHSDRPAGRRAQQFPQHHHAWFFVFFSVEYQIWHAADEKSLSSRIARNQGLISCFFSSKKTVVQTEDTLGRKDSRALNIRMILRKKCAVHFAANHHSLTSLLCKKLILTDLEWATHTEEKKK